MLRGSIRRWLLCLGAAATAVLATAATGWACASVGAIDTNPSVARPGQEVDVLVTFVNKDKPVDIRWDALDGPLLASIQPNTFTEGLHGNWRFASTKITIPADAKAGTHILIARQEAARGTATWGMPARGLIQVSGAGSPLVGQQVGPAPVARPAELVTEKAASGTMMLFIALGAAGVTMLLAGVGIILASRTQGRQAPAPVVTER